MSIGHRLFIGTLTLVVILTLVALSWLGYSYYNLPLEERFFNQAHVFLKPGGIWGHGFGIIGRFIYLQIPRSIEGRELTLSEVRDMKSNIGSILSGSYKMDEESRITIRICYLLSE